MSQHMERAAEARGRQLKELEAALRKIDQATFRQREEIEQLARDFR